MPDLPKSIGRTTRSLGAYLKWRLKQFARLCLWATVGLLSALLLFHIVENIRGHLAWSRLEKELRAKGEPLTTEELVPPPVPDDQNFANSEFFKGIFDYKLVPNEFGWADAFYPGDVHGGENMPSYEWADRRSFLLLTYLPMQSSTDNVDFKRSLNEMDFVEYLRAVYERMHPGSRRSTETNEEEARRRRFEEAYGRVYGTPTENITSPEEAFPARDYTLEERIEIVTKAVEALTPDLEKMAEAAKLPFSRFPIHYEESHALLPHITILRDMAEVAHKSAIVNIYRGKNGQAFEDLQLLKRLRDAARGEPYSYESCVRSIHERYFIQTIWEGLNHHIWDTGQLNVLLNTLATENWIVDYLAMLRSDRAYALRALDDAADGEIYFGLSDMHSLNQRVALLIRSLPTGWLKLSKRDIAEYFQTGFIDSVNTNTMSIAQDRSPIQRTVDEFGPNFWPRYLLITSALIPPYSRVFRLGPIDSVESTLKSEPFRALFTQTTSLLASTACALEIHFLEHGNYPVSLEALIPAPLDELPIDLVDREPLRYQRIDDDSYKLYSVGFDLEDGGGRIGQGWRHTAEDWVWAVGVTDETRD